MNRFPRIAVPLIALLSVWGGLVWSAAGEQDLARALSLARISGKPVALFFTASDIPPARAMEEMVLPDRAVQMALREVEFVRIDIGKDVRLASEYEVHGLPAFVVLDRDGKEIDRFKGFLPPEAFIETFRAAMDPELAPALLEQKAAADPQDLQSRWQLALKYARDRNAEGLDRVVSEIRHEDPDNELRYLEKAVFLELMTSVNPEAPEAAYEASRSYLRAFPASEHADQVDLLRAQMAYQMGNASEALQILETFSRRHPNTKLSQQVEADLRAIRMSLRN